jgi:hypothetical protein
VDELAEVIPVSASMADAWGVGVGLSNPSRGFLGWGGGGGGGGPGVELRVTRVGE